MAATRDLLARVKALTGLDDEEIGSRLAVKGETIRKYSGGYQPASTHLFELIGELPGQLSGVDLSSPVVREESSAWDEQSLPRRLERILGMATGKQVEAIRTFFEVIELSLGVGVPQPASNIVILTGEHTAVPLEHVAAGVPGEGGSIPGQVVMVPRDQAKGVDSAIRVHGDSMVGAGIHHGDIVLISRTRTARKGDIVAARCDGTDVTLKRYDVVKGKPALHAENPAFHLPVKMGDSMEILGVMLRKLS